MKSAHSSCEASLRTEIARIEREHGMLFEAANEIAHLRSQIDAVSAATAEKQNIVNLKNVRVDGLTIPQIRKLRAFYETATGQKAEAILV